MGKSFKIWHGNNFGLSNSSWGPIITLNALLKIHGMVRLT
jgi:hypothetical protein